MTTLVNRVLSQADKVNHYWFKETENEKTLENNTSPRYSLSAPPPPYEKVAQEKKYSFSSIWKRASFSSAYAPAVPDISLGPAIDKQQVEQGISLLNIATDMNRSQSNPAMAFDLYLMGLEKIMAALPLESDPNAKLALERKLVLLKQAHQLELKEPQKEPEESAQPSSEKPMRSQFSDLVIHAAVLGAVALKKSPIPDAVSGVFHFALDSMQAIDERHQIRQRTWSLATFGFSKAVEIDRQFEIHQLVTDAIYTGFSAFVKAGLAYSEAPGYQK
ncbi:hypothetical protein BY458DRAFT_517673 [Sporodiniella umbellata]|nr:hypothetical protein BY458DRAFT_517673 [Sporodiniella umbellata]